MRCLLKLLRYRRRGCQQVGSDISWWTRVCCELRTSRRMKIVWIHTPMFLYVCACVCVAEGRVICYYVHWSNHSLLIDWIGTTSLGLAVVERTMWVVWWPYRCPCPAAIFDGSSVKRCQDNAVPRYRHQRCRAIPAIADAGGRLLSLLSLA